MSGGAEDERRSDTSDVRMSSAEQQSRAEDERCEELPNLQLG